MGIFDDSNNNDFCFLCQLRERLKKIGEVGGLADLGILDESKLDDEWDPEEHEVK